MSGETLIEPQVTWRRNGISDSANNTAPIMARITTFGQSSAQPAPLRNTPRMISASPKPFGLDLNATYTLYAGVRTWMFGCQLRHDER